LPAAPTESSQETRLDDLLSFDPSAPFWGRFR
jgi:hypothetical protein